MMTRYHSYKDSGVEWIGEIPEHWEIKPLFSLCSQSKLKNMSKSNNVLSLSYGRIVKRNIISNFGLLPDSFDSYQVIKKGFTVLRLTDLQNDKKSLRVGYCSETGIITSAYISLMPVNHIMNGYFLYLFLHSADIKKVFYTLGGGLRQTLKFDELRRFEVPTPQFSEQTQIIEFLNAKTSALDKLISIKQQKIELLKEKRTALINHVVTNGLEANVKMKDIGVEWVGEIPEHWEVIKLKFVARIQGSNVDKHIFKNEIQVHLCNYTDVYKNEFINSSIIFKNGSCTNEEFKKFAISENDVIITKDSETPNDIGVPALVTENINDVVCGYHLSMIRTDPNLIIGAYLFRLLQTKYVRSYFEVNCNGITRFGLGKSIIESLTTFIPPISEQTQIVEFLNQKTKEIDNFLTLEQKKIDLLKEYRQSLISEVVTGKIKVTND